MSKPLLQFTATYIGDGSNTTFTLNTLKDPYLFTGSIVSLNPDFDHSLPVTNVVHITATAAAGDFGPVTATIEDGSLITFTLSTAPPGPPSDGGGFFTLTGYFEY